MTSVSVPDVAELRVLVVDDEADIRLGLTRLVTAVGARAEAAANGAAALERLERGGADLVLTDLMMPRMSGAELLVEVKRRWPEIEVVILTGYGTVQSAVHCLQNGAAHFLTKPFDNEAVQRLVERLGRQVLARRTPSGNGAPGAVGPGAPIAADPRTQAVLELARRVARSAVPVLIEGESGTGKELIARTVHEASAVAGGPFCALNTAALPDSLLESELFGHERGAFTGADRARAGLFERARGGTVFLDEVGSMSPAFQAALLRVLQEKVVRPLGGTGERPVEFRLIAATNRDLEARIERGEFREDLFYRLSVVRVFVPPLRERLGDVTPLALHFLERAAHTTLGPRAPLLRLSEESLRALAAHAWPGNVRELENAMQRAVIACPGDVIEPWHLGLQRRGAWGASSTPGEGPGDGAGEEREQDYAAGKQRALEEFQREFVHRALEGAGGNVSRAAQACGLTRAALQRILRQLGIDREHYGGPAA